MIFSQTRSGKCIAATLLTRKMFRFSSICDRKPWAYCKLGDAICNPFAVASRRRRE